MKRLHRIEVDFQQGRVTEVTAGWQILGSLSEGNKGELDQLCPALQCAVAETIGCVIEGRRTTSDISPSKKQIEIGRMWLDHRAQRAS